MIHIQSISIVLLLSLCTLALPSMADTVIFDTTYEGKVAGFNIDTDRRLVQLDDGTYRFTSKASNFLGSLTETSHFSTQGDVWRPLRYVYKRRIFGSKTTEAIDFDWSTMTAHYTHSDKPERNSSHTLAPGTLDPALYQLRMQRDLLLGKQNLDYRFIKRDRVRHYIIERSAREQVHVNGGEYQAIKLQRSNTEADGKQTHVWALPGLDYFFGKIIHTEDDGDTHQMTLKRHAADAQLLRAFFGTPTAPLTSPAQSQSVRPDL